MFAESTPDRSYVLLRFQWCCQTVSQTVSTATFRNDVTVESNWEKRDSRYEFCTIDSKQPVLWNTHPHYLSTATPVTLAMSLQSLGAQFSTENGDESKRLLLMAFSKSLAGWRPLDALFVKWKDCIAREINLGLEWKRDPRFSSLPKWPSERAQRVTRGRREKWPSINKVLPNRFRTFRWWE